MHHIYLDGLWYPHNYVFCQTFDNHSGEKIKTFTISSKFVPRFFILSFAQQQNYVHNVNSFLSCVQLSHLSLIVLYERREG